MPTKQELAALKAEAAATTAKDAKTISELKARIFELEAVLALLNEHAENEAKKVAARATKTEDQHRQRTSTGKSKAYSAGAKSTVVKLKQAVTAAAKAATKAAQRGFEDEVDRAVGTGEFPGMFAKIGTLFEETTAASSATAREATSAVVASEAGRVAALDATKLVQGQVRCLRNLAQDFDNQLELEREEREEADKEKGKTAVSWFESDVVEGLEDDEPSDRPRWARGGGRGRWVGQKKTMSPICSVWCIVVSRASLERESL